MHFINLEGFVTAIELPKAYDFKSTEQRLYSWWEKSGFFKPSSDPQKPDFDPNKKPFVIAIPPPNVTGELHLGHAMFVSMEDLMIRYHRMLGESALWISGQRPCRHRHPASGGTGSGQRRSEA